MKNTFKIGALSVALLAAVMVINTNAQQAQTSMSLTIQGGASTCTIDDSTLTISGLQASYSEQVTAGSFTSGAIHCEDQAGANIWNLSITTSSLVNGTDPLKEIQASAILGKASAPVVTGSCSNTSLSSTYTAINGVNLLAKTDATAICDMSLDLDIQVTVPANQAVGVYNGTLTFDAMGIAL